jgi:hypothetical protein
LVRNIAQRISVRPVAIREAGRHICQWCEHESAISYLRVRDHKAGFIDDLVTVGEDVQIKGPRAPPLITDPPSDPLDLEKMFEKLAWSDLGIEANDSVEEVILVRASQRSRLIDRGTHGDDADLRHAMNRIGEMAEPIADV